MTEATARASEEAEEWERGSGHVWRKTEEVIGAGCVMSARRSELRQRNGESRGRAGVM